MNRLLGLVVGEDYSPPRGIGRQLAGELKHALFADRIEIARGLVEHEKGGAGGERGGDGEALLLTPGEGGGAAARQVREPYQAQQSPDPLGYLRPGKAQAFGAEGGLELDVRGEELGLEVLKHQADVAGALGYGNLPGVAPGHQHFAAQGARQEVRDEAVEAPAEGGFAGPAGSHHHQEVAGVEVEREAPERGCRGLAVGEGQVAYGEERTGAVLWFVH